MLQEKARTHVIQQFLLRLSPPTSRFAVFFFFHFSCVNGYEVVALYGFFFSFFKVNLLNLKSRERETETDTHCPFAGSSRELYRTLMLQVWGRTACWHNHKLQRIVVS